MVDYNWDSVNPTGTWAEPGQKLYGMPSTKPSNASYIKVNVPIEKTAYYHKTIAGDVWLRNLTEAELIKLQLKKEKTTITPPSNISGTDWDIFRTPGEGVIPPVTTGLEEVSGYLNDYNVRKILNDTLWLWPSYRKRGAVGQAIMWHHDSQGIHITANVYNRTHNLLEENQYFLVRWNRACASVPEICTVLGITPEYGDYPDTDTNYPTDPSVTTPTGDPGTINTPTGQTSQVITGYD